MPSVDFVVHCLFGKFNWPHFLPTNPALPENPGRNVKWGLRAQEAVNHQASRTARENPEIVDT